MPNALLEALACGLPCVATRVSGSEDVISDGVNGLLVREEDPADLAEKLLRLIDDPKLRARMAEASRQRFAEQYTHVQYGRRMIAVFEALAGHAL